MGLGQDCAVRDRTKLEQVSYEIHQALERIESACRRLEERIEHVVHPAAPQKASNSVSVEQSVVGVVPLVNAAVRANDIADRIHDLSDRIGV